MVPLLPIIMNKGLYGSIIAHYNEYRFIWFQCWPLPRIKVYMVPLLPITMNKGLYGSIVAHYHE